MPRVKRFKTPQAKAYHEKSQRAAKNAARQSDLRIAKSMNKTADTLMHQAYEAARRYY